VSEMRERELHSFFLYWFTQSQSYIQFKRTT